MWPFFFVITKTNRTEISLVCKMLVVFLSHFFENVVYISKNARNHCNANTVQDINQCIGNYHDVKKKLK